MMRTTSAAGSLVDPVEPLFEGQQFLVLEYDGCGPHELHVVVVQSPGLGQQCALPVQRVDDVTAVYPARRPVRLDRSDIDLPVFAKPVLLDDGAVESFRAGLRGGRSC